MSRSNGDFVTKVGCEGALESKLHLGVPPNEGNSLSLEGHGICGIFRRQRGKAGQLEYDQIIVRSACQAKTKLYSAETKESPVISEQRNNSFECHVLGILT